MIKFETIKQSLWILISISLVFYLFYSTIALSTIDHTISEIYGSYYDVLIDNDSLKDNVELLSDRVNLLSEIEEHRISFRTF